MIIVGTTLATESRADGSFDLRRVPVRPPRACARSASAAASRSSTVEVRAGEAAAVRSRYGADPLALDAVVVSGTFNPASKLESSTAITTFSAQQVEQQAPRGTAELLKSAPGLPGDEQLRRDRRRRHRARAAASPNSSFRYVSLQEDGLPAFEAPGLLFAFPDAMARLDETVARVEAVRGGSAAVFGSEHAGRHRQPDQQDRRADVRRHHAHRPPARREWGGSTPTSADRWPARGASTPAATTATTAGCATPASPRTRAGSSALNATRDFASGHARIYGKYLNERDVWYLGIPIQNYTGSARRSPAGRRSASGTMFARERLKLTVPDAFHPGPTVTPT